MLSQKDPQSDIAGEDVAEAKNKESNDYIDWEKVKEVSQKDTQSDIGGDLLAEAGNEKSKGDIVGLEEPVIKECAVDF